MSCSEFEGLKLYLRDFLSITFGVISTCLIRFYNDK